MKHSLPKTILAALVAGALAVSALPARAGAASADREFRWEGELAAGQNLAVRGFNGWIRANDTDGRVANVLAEISGRDSDRLEVRVFETAEGIELCAVERGHRRDAEDCHGARRGGWGDLQAKVEYRIQVPRGVHLHASTGNGGIEAEGLTGNVDASTGNGQVEVSTSGLARASSGNGSLDVEMGRADWDGELSFSAGNGSIRLSLPAGLEAEVDASTGNGGIDTDFPITVEGRSWSPHHLHGTIGDGGRTLKLSTGNGSIVLRRGG